MRIAPKLVAGTSTAPQSSTSQSSRHSFVDTLANVSGTWRLKQGGDKSGTHSASDERPDDSEQNEDQGNRWSLKQCRQSSDVSKSNRQGETASSSVKQVESKLDNSKVSHLSEASSETADDSVSHKNDSLKANFTGQVGSPFALQNSTVQPESSGMFFFALTASESADKGSQPESTEQSVSDPLSRAISGQESGQQSHAGTQVPIEFRGAEALQCERGIGEGRDSADILTAESAGQPALPSTSPDPSMTLVAPSTPAAQLSASGVGGAARDGESLDAASILQTSLAAKAQQVSTTKSGDGNSLQATAKLSQSKTGTSIAGLNSNVGDAARSGRDSTVGDVGSLSHGSIGTGSQISAVQAKGSEAGVLQLILPATPATVHGSAGTTASSDFAGMETHRGDGDDNPAMERWMGGDSAGMSGISTAQIIQNMSESVMRVGMHSIEFGDISIRTAVSQQQMQTQIAVDHNELGNALAAHIPSVQAKLGSDYGLHANIQVNQGGATFSDARDGSSQQQKNSTAQPAQVTEFSTAIQEDAVATRSVTVASGDYRLDVRA